MEDLGLHVGCNHKTALKEGSWFLFPFPVALHGSLAATPSCSCSKGDTQLVRRAARSFSGALAQMGAGDLAAVKPASLRI